MSRRSRTRVVPHASVRGGRARATRICSVAASSLANRNARVESMIRLRNVP